MTVHFAVFRIACRFGQRARDDLVRMARRNRGGSVPAIYSGVSSFPLARALALQVAFSLDQKRTGKQND